MHIRLDLSNLSQILFVLFILFQFFVLVSIFNWGRVILNE